MIDFQDSTPLFLHNPKLSPQWKDRLQELQHQLPDLPGHIWILSSGSSATTHYKWIALSKAGFLKAAAGANQHLQSDASDRWLLTLPEFHVGGLSVWARAHLSGAHVEVAPGPWDAENFVKTVRDHHITLTSLVPTQVFDLIQAGLPCPPSLRAIIVGGGALGADLYEQGRRLGYPLLPSYGLTECGSQVATASLESLKHRHMPGLKPLPHVHIQISSDGMIEIKSEALLSGWALMSLQDFEFMDPKVDGFFQTEDLGQWQSGNWVEPELLVLGRKTEVVKVGGELVSLPRLNDVLRMILQQEGAPDSGVVLTVPDERLGQAPVLLLEHSWVSRNHDSLLDRMREKVAPFEVPRALYFVRSLSWTELGKPKTAEMKALLGF